MEKKMVFRLLSVSIAVASLAIASAACHAETVVDLYFANGDGANTRTGGSFALSTADAGSATGIAAVIGGVLSTGPTVTLSDGGFTGVYSLSTNIITNGGSDFVSRGLTGALGTETDGLIGPPTPFGVSSVGIENVELTFESGDDVFLFDGYTGVLFGNADAGEVGTVGTGPNAIDFSFDAGDDGIIASADAFAPIGDLLTQPTFVAAFGEGLSVNAVRAQFVLNPDVVTVPEPSSIALIGLSSLIVFRRRRR